MPLADIFVRSESQGLANLSVGLRRSEIDGHFSCHLCPRDVARLCGIQFLGIRIVSSVIPLSDIFVRSESQRLANLSVGLRRSEIDGHFF